jgi:hypothetical protein
MTCKMKRILIPILLGLSFLAGSCQHLLDIPQKGVISEADFYASDEDAAALLANMYASLLAPDGVASSSGIYNSQLMILNYSADDVLAAGGEIDDHLDFRVFDEFRYDDANTPLLNLYYGYERGIYAANLIISHFSTENIDGEEPYFSSDFTDQCVEEARVMRAYLHMMMALSWYAPNIVDRLLAFDELPVQARDQSQVLKWVIAECEKAIRSGKLPDRDGPGDQLATARMSVLRPFRGRQGSRVQQPDGRCPPAPRRPHRIRRLRADPLRRVLDPLPPGRRRQLREDLRAEFPGRPRLHQQCLGHRVPQIPEPLDGCQCALLAHRQPGFHAVRL